MTCAYKTNAEALESGKAVTIALAPRYLRLTGPYNLSNYSSEAFALVGSLLGTYHRIIGHGILS